MRSNEKDHKGLMNRSALIRDGPARSSPHPPGRRRNLHLLTGLLTLAAMFILLVTTAFAAESRKTTKDIVTTNGDYAIVVIDEAGNIVIKGKLVENIERAPLVDDDGNILPDTKTEDEYTEDIIATLVAQEIAYEDGTYTAFVFDQAGNANDARKSTITIRNIGKKHADDGKDNTGNVVPDTGEEFPDDYTEDIVERLTDGVTVDENGRYTAFVSDQAGNITKRSIYIENIIEKTKPSPDTPIDPGRTEDSEEDYTEDITNTATDNKSILQNGKYAAAVMDQAGNITFAEVSVTNIKEDTGDDDKDDVIQPEPVPDSDEDYTEDIEHEATSVILVTKSGVYTSIAKDRTGNMGLETQPVKITESEEPDHRDDVIKPDDGEPEFPSDEGSSMTDTRIVFENGVFAAGAVDNVDNIGFGTAVVKNIGAPDVHIISNPYTLLRKTADDGTTYGEATIKFSVKMKDGAALKYVKLVNAEDASEVYEPVSAGEKDTYIVTVTKNGSYEIRSEDVTGRTGVYPVIVDYIYDLNPDAEIDVMEGEDVTINANVEGGTPETFQWYTCDADGTNGKAIEGANLDVLKFEAVDYTKDDTYYYCIATKGDYVVVSRIIHLNVNHPPVIQASSYIVAEEGKTLKATVGKENTDTIRIITDGKPNDYTYQWYFAVNSRATPVAIEGATSATFEETATASRNGGYLFCEIKSSKCSVMSKGIFVYVIGKPTAPQVVARLQNNTIIPSNQWSINKPVTVTIGNSTANGTVGQIEYKYRIVKTGESHDDPGLNAWKTYEGPLVFDKDTKNTTIYVKAVNNSHGRVVESDEVIHVVKIETTNPNIYEQDDDVVPGIRFDNKNWSNEPKTIHMYVNSLSGVEILRVKYKGENDSEMAFLAGADGTVQFTKLTDPDAELVPGTFRLTELVETATVDDYGLWRVDFLAEQNGWYQADFVDAAGLPLDSTIGTEPFEVTHIDYDRPTIGSAQVNTEADANEKYIQVRDAYDQYTSSIYGYSQAYAYAYVKDSDVVPEKDSDKWIPFTDSNSTCTVDANGTRHYDFDILIKRDASDENAEDPNGTYYVYVRDEAGNISEVKVVEVKNLHDKMQDIEFDHTENSTIDMTVPTDEYVHVSFIGSPGEIIASSSNDKVATATYELTGDTGCTLTIHPQDYGTATITFTLKDYDGTEHTLHVKVNVKNLPMSIKSDLQDVTAKPNAKATFEYTIEGTNMTFTWYEKKPGETTYTEIKTTDAAYTQTVESSSATIHTVRLTINQASPAMTGYTYWCVAQATEATPAYTKQTRTATLTVAGNVSAPKITANEGRLTSGTWTNSSISFLFTDSVISSGSGNVGYQYRYDSETVWYDSVGTLTYTGDTHEKVLHVRAYNTLDREVVSDETDFIIRFDTVAPTGSISGNPTTWVKEAQSLVLTITDADSGTDFDTAKLTVKDEAGAVVTTEYTDAGAGKYGFSVAKNGTYTVLFHDRAGNEASTTVTVTKIDNTKPDFSISHTAIDGNGKCTVTVTALDDVTPTADLRYTFDGGTTWTANNFAFLVPGQYRIGVMDLAGNERITLYKVTEQGSGGSGGGGGGGEAAVDMFESEDLKISEYTFTKEGYLDETGTFHEYDNVVINGVAQKGLRVDIGIFPAKSGFVSATVKLTASNKTTPVYWDENSTVTVTDEGGTGHFFITPALLVRSGYTDITIDAKEYRKYEDGKLSNRSCSDQLTLENVLIDCNPPSPVRIEYSSATGKVTISVSDGLSDMLSVEYAFVRNGTKYPAETYTGPFEEKGSVNPTKIELTKPSDATSIIVTATDKARNSVTVTGDLTSDTYNDSDANAKKFSDSYYYRTVSFNYWLIGTGASNVK